MYQSDDCLDNLVVVIEKIQKDLASVYQELLTEGNAIDILKEELKGEKEFNLELSKENDKLVEENSQMNAIISRLEESRNTYKKQFEETFVKLELAYEHLRSMTLRRLSFNIDEDES